MTTVTGMAGAEVVCGTLAALGARHVFGLPGTQSTGFYEALRRSSLKSVVPTHELSAAFMAGAYARAGGRPGVLTSIPGPGLAYTLAGLAEARLDSAAIVYIVNGREAASRPGFGPQAIDQHALLQPVTKAIVSVDDGDRLEEAVRTAWALAQSGEPGPVALELSPDTGTHGMRIIGEDDRATASPDDAEVAAAWRHIAHARRPLIIAGQGALGAASAVETLARRLGAPILTTPSARGLVPETSPLAMGFDVLRGRLDAANRLIASADAVLVLGAKLAHNGSAGSRLVLAAERTVRVDTSAAALDATYPAAHRLAMDVAAFLARPEALEVAGSAWSATDLAEARAMLRSPEPRHEPRIAGVNAVEFFAALRAALPDDARLVTDTGLHQVMARRHLDITGPGGLLMPSDFQSMGFGLPAAIAARLADPSRPVVAMIGDGGLRMTGFELATAVRERLPLTLVVLNDGYLNQIRQQQLADHGVASGTELGPLDVAAFADAVGASYVLADTPHGLATALGGSLHAAGVTLVEVPVGDTPAIRAAALKARAKGAARATLGNGVSARLKALVRGG